MSIARYCRLVVTLGMLLSIALCGSAAADLIADGSFDDCASSKQLRTDNKGQDWAESRKDTKAGRNLLKLSTKPIAGNATPKAMIKAHPDLNTYLTQRLAKSQKGEFSVQFDIMVRRILADDNRSGFCFVGSEKDDKNGPNSTGRERFVFLGFENAAAGKINLFAREGNTGWAEKTIVAAELDLETWYTITIRIYVADQEYEVTVGEDMEPVALEAFRSGSKRSPKKLTHLSFASWNDGAGTFYVDNVQADEE